VPRQDGPQDGPVQQPPSNTEAVRLMTVFCRRYAKEWLSRTLHHRQWELAVTPLGQGSRPGMMPFCEIRPPNDRFWADPFPVLRDGRCSLFFEEFPYGNRRGRIMVAGCDRRGFQSEPECVLERPYHLSYPMVFESRGGLYMMPETRANRTIEVYECTDFPRKWELCRTLMQQIDASDPTPVFIQGRWWLFTNVGRSASAYDDLYLFHSDDLLGKWTPHRGNPVKCDVRSGRSAGRIVIADGKVYRLSQDCSRRYGFAVNAHEITRLDPAAYQERFAGRMHPVRGSRRLLGIHTANAAGDLLFIDGMAARSRLPLSAETDPFRELRIRGCDFWS